MRVSLAGLGSARDGASVAARVPWVAIAPVLAAIPFLDTLGTLLRRWLTDPNDSHGVLAPLVSAYLIAISTAGDASSRRTNEMVGTGLFLLGLVLKLATRLVPSLFLESIGLILALSGAVWLTSGRAGWGRARGGLLFLVFMIPWPAAVMGRLTQPLQLWVCQGAEIGLEALNVPVLREGTVLATPHGRLHVAEACSGLRQLTAFLAIGAAVALFAPKPWPVRLLLVASAIPVAVAVNTLRVIVVALSLPWLGSALIDGPWHAAEGLILVGVGVAAMLGVLRVVDGLFPNESPPRAASSRPLVIAPAGVGVLSALVLFGLVADRAVANWTEARLAATSTGLNSPLATLPERLGAWVGVDEPIDPELVRAIKVDDSLQRVYLHPGGERATLWLSYSRRSADQYHYPTVCMSGKGWREDEASRCAIDIDGGDALRLRFHREGERQTVHYWYYLIGEGPLDRWLRRMSQSARGFLRGRRNASLTVEVFSHGANPDSDRLDELARLAAAAIRPLLPTPWELDHQLGAAH